MLPVALLCALCAAIAWIDIRHGIIPDWLNLAIAVLGLLRIFLAGDTSDTVMALGEAEEGEDAVEETLASLGLAAAHAPWH